MQTIIVEVSVPSISGKFDFRLPSTGRIGDIINEIVYVLEATQQNVRFIPERTILCDRDQHRILSRGETVAEAGLRDSAQLMLL